MLCERDQMSNLDQVADTHGYKFPAEQYFFAGREGHYFFISRTEKKLCRLEEKNRTNEMDRSEI